MTSQTVTIKLPGAIYRSAQQMALATHQPMEQVLQESIARTLPPLDDVSPEEATALAQMALLEDGELWRQARAELPLAQQQELERLLNRQESGELTDSEKKHLLELLDEYGKLTVRKAHAWLLLARRGYHVPPQS